MEPAWAQEMQNGFVSHLLWILLDARLLYANLMAASVVAVVLPLLYFLQRAKLHGEHRMQLRILKEFAGADPDLLIDQPRADQDRHENAQSDRSSTIVADDDDRDQASSEPSPGIAEEAAWFDVLGLAPSATIDEVREAYRVQIKQNHPDRVHGMSPLFRELAEAETKKLNAAYEEALSRCRGRDRPGARSALAAKDDLDPLRAKEGPRPFAGSISVDIFYWCGHRSIGASH